MIKIFTPSLAFFSNSLSRRYFGIPGLRKLSSALCQPDSDGNEANTNRETATSHECRSCPSQVESHVIGSRNSPSVTRISIQQAWTTQDIMLTPSTSH